jgi:hypothetical protein
MANTLTGLIPSLYAGLHTVSRELVGYIPAVSRNGGVERAAVGQNVTYHVAPRANGVNITPAMTIPEPTDQTIGNDAITISKARAYEFGFVGEEQLGLNNNGAGYNQVQADMFAEALRSLTNEIELDLAVAAAAGASRAHGTAGTTPFATGVGDSAQVRKILDDNGAPPADRWCVASTTTGAALRTNLQLTKVNEGGQDQMLRQGELIDLHNISYAESGQAVTTAASAGSGYLINSAVLAVGDTVIAVDTGTGALAAGEFFTIAGDTNKYTVAEAYAGGAGNITIAEPGLLVAPADNAAITNSGAFETNVAFHRNAIRLAIRPPELPEEGDAAMDSKTLLDPRSGLVFEVRIYGGYRKVRYEVGAAWGQKVIDSAHVAMLLG